MDRPAQGHKRNAMLRDIQLSALELEELKSFAHAEYLRAGDADIARAWVVAIDRWLAKHDFKLVKGGEHGTK